jgi:putative colanic acid biosynthesis UDP-glucose lipid carrier transferase
MTSIARADFEPAEPEQKKEEPPEASEALFIPQYPPAGSAGDPRLRVPWVSRLGPGLGAIERTSPLIALFRATIDPLAIASTLYLLAYLKQGELTGIIFCVGVLAFLLAGYLMNGPQLLLQGRGMRQELLSLLFGWFLILAAMMVIGYVSGVSHLVDSRLFLMWALVTPPALFLLHALVYLLMRGTAVIDHSLQSAVIVGATQSGRALAAVMRKQPLLRLSFLGFFDDRPCSRTNADPALILGRLDDLAAYVSSHGVKSIYITLPMTSQPRIMSLLDALRDTTATVYFVPDMFVFDLIQARFDHVGGIPVMSVCDSPFEGFNGLAKRASDIVMSLLALMLLWPAMLGIAIAIKATSPGPVTFRQRRYGLDGEEIVVYKFRSMTVMEDGDSVRQASRNDQRLTRIGGFLRRTSLDELPQFVNVLQGRMSIVGPRPHATAHNEQYRKIIKGYMIRHKVRPGITGWAQVNGFRGETDTLEKMQGRIAHDLDYLRNWSPWLDLRIIARTALLVCRDPQAY